MSELAEYKVLKGELLAKSGDRNVMNAVIRDSIEAAYNNLSDEDRNNVDNACDALQEYSWEKNKSITRQAALEVVAALGNWLNTESKLNVRQ